MKLSYIFYSLFIIPSLEVYAAQHRGRIALDEKIERMLNDINRFDQQLDRLENKITDAKVIVRPGDIKRQAARIEQKLDALSMALSQTIMGEKVEKEEASPFEPVIEALRETESKLYAIKEQIEDL